MILFKSIKDDFKWCGDVVDEHILVYYNDFDGYGHKMYKLLFLKGIEIDYINNEYKVLIRNMYEMEIFREVSCKIYRKGFEYINRKEIEKIFR